VSRQALAVDTGARRSGIVVTAVFDDTCGNLLQIAHGEVVTPAPS
jgi:hypothetical protein